MTERFIMQAIPEGQEGWKRWFSDHENESGPFAFYLYVGGVANDVSKWKARPKADREALWKGLIDSLVSVTADFQQIPCPGDGAAVNHPVTLSQSAYAGIYAARASIEAVLLEAEKKAADEGWDTGAWSMAITPRTGDYTQYLTDTQRATDSTIKTAQEAGKAIKEGAKEVAKQAGKGAAVVVVVVLVILIGYLWMEGKI